MNKRKEYYKVYEVSQKFKITTRYVRNKCKELYESGKYVNLITKDSEGQWLIHDLTLPNFKRKRKKKQKYYALTVDFTSTYSVSDIEKIVSFACNNMKVKNLEFYYTIEKGMKKGKNHIHAFTNSNRRTDIRKNLRLGFSEVGYKEVPIYDLEGWKNYITKEGNKIIEIKN